MYVPRRQPYYGPKLFFFRQPYYGPKLFGYRPARMNGWWLEPCEACRPEIVIIGNSHCVMYGPVLQKLADEYQTPLAMYAFAI